MSRHSANGRPYWRLRQHWLATAPHGWTCWLCHEPVDPHARARGDRPTIDHVQPTSTGRVDPLDTTNWRLAHQRCNSARQDSPAPLGTLSRAW
jgi:5-methylcytosine-specific restriction endonuclease McrA